MDNGDRGNMTMFNMTETNATGNMTMEGHKFNFTMDKNSTINGNR